MGSWGPSITTSDLGGIDDCIEALSRALADGSVALGFEAPMSVPYREDANQLDRCRNRGRDRSFFCLGRCLRIREGTNLPAATDLRSLAATIKARWICEQAHAQLKEELGLGHVGGRSWQGLHPTRS